MSSSFLKILNELEIVYGNIITFSSSENVLLADNIERARALIKELKQFLKENITVLNKNKNEQEKETQILIERLNVAKKIMKSIGTDETIWKN